MVEYCWPSRVSVAAAGSRRAVSATICWVRVSSRSVALITRSRSFSNASLWVSSSRSALAAATTTRVNSSRRCSGDSGMASSRVCRTLKACARVFLAFSSAVRNGAVSVGPNSSTARANSPSLVRTALSTSTTMALDSSSSASMGTDARAFGSVGSTRWAAANSACRRLLLRRRPQTHSASPSATITPKTTRKPTHDTPVPPPGEDGAASAPSPSAAPMAACAQSLSRSAGSIRSRWTAAARLWVLPSTAKENSRSSVATASRASSSPNPLSRQVLSAHVWPLCPSKVSTNTTNNCTRLSS